jgi:hypothetical protein
MLQLLTAIRSLLVAGVTIGMKLTKKKSIKSISTLTFNHNQDPDGEDGSILGDHGRAEAKDLPTTRRMQNMIQSTTRQTGIGGPFRRQNKNEQSHSRGVIRINGQYVPLVAEPKQPTASSNTSVVGTSILEEEDNIGPK